MKQINLTETYRHVGGVLVVPKKRHSGCEYKPRFRLLLSVVQTTREGCRLARKGKLPTQRLTGNPFELHLTRPLYTKQNKMEEQNELVCAQLIKSFRTCCHCSHTGNVYRKSAAKNTNGTHVPLIASSEHTEAMLLRRFRTKCSTRRVITDRSQDVTCRQRCASLDVS